VFLRAGIGDLGLGLGAEGTVHVNLGKLDPPPGHAYRSAGSIQRPAGQANGPSPEAEAAGGNMDGAARDRDFSCRKVSGAVEFVWQCSVLFAACRPPPRRRTTHV